MARMCMSSNSQTGKMKNQTVFRFLLLYNVFETVYRIVQAADGRTHGKFVSINIKSNVLNGDVMEHLLLVF